MPLEQGPTADDLLLEELIAQAAMAPDDEAAQATLRSHVQEVIDSGNLERTMAMGMYLGATACLYDHLESAANMVSEAIGGNRDHSSIDDHGHDSKKVGDKKKKKDNKNKKSSFFYSWLEW